MKIFGLKNLDRVGIEEKIKWKEEEAFLNLSDSKIDFFYIFKHYGFFKNYYLFMKYKGFFYLL